MTLSSMTGFARSDGTSGGVRWTWELRSVNGKGLDVRIRLPGGFERLEQPARERCAARLTRGNVQASLVVAAGEGGQRFSINEGALSQVLAAIEEIARRVDTRPPAPEGILALRGILEVEDVAADDAAREALDAGLLAGLDRALADLSAMREREGAAIGEVLKARLRELAELTARAEASPARAPDTIHRRLSEQIAMLLDAAPALDPDRLHQEAVLLATKADIREELDRLHAHIAAAGGLISAGGTVGRRLDFLAQEFNREVNTLCAKSNDRALTAIGLDMKAVVDQLREQLQNLE